MYGKRDHCPSFNRLKKDTTPVEEMVSEFLLNIDSHNSAGPIVCVACKASLETYLNFKTKYSYVEEKIKEYGHVEKLITKCQIKLGTVRQLMIKDIPNFESKFGQLNVIKTEEFSGSGVYEENHLKYDFLKLEEPPLDIKEERVQAHVDNGSSARFKNILHFSQPKGTIKISTLEKPSKGAAVANSETHQKKDSSDMRVFKTKQREGIKWHKEIPEIPTVNRYQCNECEYGTGYKLYFRRHMRKHRNGSEVKLYQCDVCQYKTKFRYTLNRHRLIHEDDSKVTKYQCEVCGHWTKHKYSIGQHMLLHKGDSKVAVYQCEVCKLRTKTKSHLKKHMLIHKDDSEVKMYKCEVCEYKTKKKSNLKQHTLIHKDASEVVMYQCGVCEYRTKIKSHLKQHMLIHKDDSAVTMYECNECNYKTKLKGCLRQHNLIHKDDSEATIYHCELCEYKTKIKRYLSQHVQRFHKKRLSYNSIPM